MKRLLTLLSTLFMSGCAGLLNSSRPAYSGPIVKPIWTVQGLAFDGPVLIHDGLVYVRARPWEKDEKRLYAFDLKTGKQLWVSNFFPETIKFIVGPLLFAVDNQGIGHSVNAKTGKDLLQPGPTALLHAVVAGDIVYGVWQDKTVTAMDNPQHAVWRAKVPMNILNAPVVAGGTVYVGGRLEKDGGTEACQISAFDAKTGAVRWIWNLNKPQSDLFFSNFSVDADSVYVWVGASSNIVIAIDAATGKQKWTSKSTAYFPEGPMLFEPATVVVRDSPPLDKNGASKAWVHVFRGLKRTTGEPVWETSTLWRYEKWTYNREGLLFVADRKVHAMLNEGGDTSPDSWLTVADVRAGKELWRSEMVELAEFSEPAVGEGFAVVASSPFRFQNPKAGFLAAYHASRDGK